MTSSNYIYISNPNFRVLGPRNYYIATSGIERAVRRTHIIINQISNFEIDIFALLGLRNLSALVGEVFAAAMIQEHQEIFKKNPHQDGYPDLLLLDEAGLLEWNRLSDRLREKEPFSPFSTDGFEVKATCGAVLTPTRCRKLGLEKPGMRDQRVKLLTGYEWKAHHRETNYLFGLFWDFIDGCPTIVAIFYSNNLSEQDWGAIVQPTEGGGRTTSVSIMNSGGVQKMYSGWVTFLAQEPYAVFFDARNRDARMRNALFQLQCC
jgi:hypothetical protein